MGESDDYPSRALIDNESQDVEDIDVHFTWDPEDMQTTVAYRQHP
ncbi:hypothetical protein ACFVTE_18360 [Arthrobacter sp. NPDC058097]